MASNASGSTPGRPAPILIAAVVLILLASTGAFMHPVAMAIRPQNSRASSAAASGSVDSSVEGKVDHQMSETYESLAARLIDRYNKECNTLQNGQLFVCIAGGPGSGKSTLSTAVAALINERMPPKDAGGEGGNNNGSEGEAAVVLPMDGFHYSRAQLQSMGESPDIEHTYEDLLARRGAPWTFDAEGCIAAFTAARRTGSASLPVYSRAKSDPVSDGVQLCSTTKIVLMEGNYLLSWGDERWAPFQTNNVFDEAWYVKCTSLEEQRERLVKRHLETWSSEKTKMFGEGEAGAGKKADSNDMLNLGWIEEMSRGYADLVVESV